MTRLERIVLRHQIDAARRRLSGERATTFGPNEVDGVLARVFPDYEPVLMEDEPGSWMPQCPEPPRAKLGRVFNSNGPLIVRGWWLNG